MLALIQPILAANGELSVNSSGITISIWPLIIYTLLVILMLLAIFYLLRKILGIKHKLSSTFDKKIFKVTVPKYDQVNKESTDDENKWQETVGHMESFFSSLGGLKSDPVLKKALRGVANHISFEIVAMDGKIFFYIAIPTSLERFIIQQIHAQFPSAHIEETPDYNIFKPQSAVYGSYLILARKHALPLKTYKEMETDPLNSLTNALSKLSKEEGASIQVLVTSASPSWRNQSKEIVAKIQAGDSPENIKTGNSFASRAFNSIFSTVFNSWSGQNKKDKKDKESHQLSPLEQKMVESIEEKISKAGLEVNIRVVVATNNEVRAKNYLQDITNSFSQFNIYEYGNSFKSIHFKPNSKVVSDFIYRNFNRSMKIVLNTQELSSLYHFPDQSTDTPNISWLDARQASPPINMPSAGVILGQSNYRGEKIDVRINTDDRRRHIYIIGQTGTGKSTLMKNIMIQDIKNGKGACVIDPHGDLALDILKNIPPERSEDVVYFNPADTERPIGLNMLEHDSPEQKTFVVNELLSIFDKLYDLKATGGPMFEQYMRNALLLVMADPQSGMTLLEVPRVLSDENFRKYKLERCDNIAVRDFWQKEALQAGGEAALANMVPYITSKLTPFIANDIMRPIIAQTKSSINFREIMDKKKILIVNLTKGKLGDLNSQLLGMIITGKILMAALSRVDMPEEDRHDFYLFIDEFQNFTTESIAIILSEARKYRLNLTLANQYIGQLVNNNDTTIKDAIFGNIGTTIAFRIGVEDAEIIAKQMSPIFNEYDVVNIPKFTAYIKLLIDNANPSAFNFSIQPTSIGDTAVQKNIIELSRQKYGKPREVIENEIRHRVNLSNNHQKN